MLAEMHKDLYDVLTGFSKAKSINHSAVGIFNYHGFTHPLHAQTVERYRQLYLNCDPTMSHYLKLVCDMIFAERNFRNEIIWQRTSTHNDSKQGAKHFGRVTDTILFYSKDIKQQSLILFIKNIQKNMRLKDIIKLMNKEEDLRLLGGIGLIHSTT